MVLNTPLSRGWVLSALCAVMVLTSVWVTGAKEAPKPSVVGAGRIGVPIVGETIPSPSDFGFAVNDDGGTFVCSMAGPETGGFAGFQVMLVEGPAAAKTLRVSGRHVSFAGKATVVLIPGMNGASQTVLNGIPYSVSARTGNSGTASMILSIPAFTQAVGGDTGGIVRQGAIGFAGRDPDDER
jgi:hypothetical protein